MLDIFGLHQCGIFVINRMQIAAWRRFFVGMIVICVHGLLFALLRPGLQQHAMPLPPREIMIALLPSTPVQAAAPAPKLALQKPQKPQKLQEPQKIKAPAPAPAPKPIPVVAATPSVMPSRPVTPSPSEAVVPAPAHSAPLTQAAPSPVAAAPTPTTTAATTTSPAHPKTVTSGVEYLQKPAPVYPTFSRRMQEEGKVILRVLVNLKGKPEQVEIQKSSGFPRLDEAARQTVLSSYLFKPYSENGQVQSVFVLIPINFQLNN